MEKRERIVGNGRPNAGAVGQGLCGYTPGSDTVRCG